MKKLVFSLIIFFNFQLNASQSNFLEYDEQGKIQNYQVTKYKIGSSDPLIDYLKNKGIDLSKYKVIEQNNIFQAIWHWSREIERPLKDNDLFPTVLRGALIGFTTGMLDRADIFLHNLLHFGAGQLGEIVGEKIIATAGTALTIELVTTLIHSSISLANPLDFKGRQMTLLFLGYQGYFREAWNEKVEESFNFAEKHIKSLPINLQNFASSSLFFLKDNKINLRNFAEKYFNDNTKSLSNFLIKDGIGYEISQMVQMNPYDLLNNYTYGHIRNFITSFKKPLEKVIIPISKNFGRVASQILIKDRIPQPFSPLKPAVESFIESKITRFPLLEKELDPLFIEFGKQYAQKVFAYYAKWVIDMFEFQISPVLFVTEKQHPNKAIAILYNVTNAVKSIFSSSDKEKNLPEYKKIILKEE